MTSETIRALEIGLEYTKEHLARHGVELGRKHPHLALEAKQIEEDIRDIQKAIARADDIKTLAHALIEEHSSTGDISHLQTLNLCFEDFVTLGSHRLTL